MAHRTAVTFASWRRACSADDGLQPSFNRIDATNTGVKIPGKREQAGLGDAEHGIGRLPRFGQGVEPAFDNPQLAGIELCSRVGLKDLHRGLDIRAATGVTERLFR